jgi:hypothetical protein
VKKEQRAQYYAKKLESCKKDHQNKFAELKEQYEIEKDYQDNLIASLTREQTLFKE